MRGQYKSNEFLIYGVCDTFIFLIKSIIVGSVISQFSTSAQTKTNLELFRRKKNYVTVIAKAATVKKLPNNCLFNTSALPGTVGNVGNTAWHEYRLRQSRIFAIVLSNYHALCYFFFLF